MQDRVKPLERVLNFRDFGGYPTEDGGSVKAGLLFRSAHLSEATGADRDAIRRLGVRLVVDLRRPDERRLQPNLWPEPADPARLVTEDHPEDSYEPPHLAFLRSAELTGDSVRAFMRETYRRLPFDPRLIALYRHWFAALAEGEAPALVHCAAGKDRTGVICALTLIALGVPQDAAIDDYLLTNDAVGVRTRMPKIAESMGKRFGRVIPEEAVLPFLGVEADYLHAMFVTLAEAGGPTLYLQETLGVDADLQARLRRLYLAA